MTKYLIVLAFVAGGFSAVAQSSTTDDRKLLEKTTVAIRDAFAAG